VRPKLLPFLENDYVTITIAMTNEACKSYKNIYWKCYTKAERQTDGHISI